MNREHLKEFINNVLEKYPNFDFKHLLPRENIFKRLLKKDITMKEFNTIYNDILDAILQLELKRFPYTDYVSNESYTRLSEAISRYNRIKMCTEIKDNIFKYYPISIDEETSKILYINVMKEIIKTYIETGIFIESLIEKEIEKYSNSIDNYKSVLKNTTMMPYYGTPNYIISRSRYILDCAKKMNVDTTKLENLIQKLEVFNKVYPNASKKKYLTSYPYFKDEYKIAYRNLEEIYLQILEIEDALMPANEQKWKNYLTNPLNHDDTNFKYLIHVFTGGFVPPSEMQKACTTLVTNSLMAIPYGTFGLIYDFTKEAVDTICTEDAGSWIVTKEEFLDNDLLMGTQLQHPDKGSVFYETETNSKLVTPEEVEQIGIIKNLKYNNNQPLTYDMCLYTEIFLNNKAKVLGVFYTDDCKNKQEVMEYAKKYNLPVIHLSLQKLRLMNQRKQMINKLLEQTKENSKFLTEEKLDESKKM